MMIKSEKKIRDLAEILNHKNSLAVSEAIHTLRDDTPFEGAIGLLTAFYDKSDDTMLRKAVASFMNDIKNPMACGEVINEIKKQWKADTVSMLVSSCWQSGLDYSSYSIDLARVFLEGDYVTAIECLTVIEASLHNLTSKQKSEIRKLIEDNPFPVSNEKITLTHELLSILDR